MIRAFFVAWAFQAAVATVANAIGPYGTIHVGNWMGGADTDDSNGALSHCAAGSDYESGVSLIARLAATSSWLLGFASQRFDFNKDALPIGADARVVGATLPANQSLTYPLASARKAYVVPAFGQIRVNGMLLDSGDGAAIEAEDEILIEAEEQAEIILVDVA